MEAADEDSVEGGNVKAAAVKGTVRPLADSISVEEAERASSQVRDAITQQQRQLAELQRFSSENRCLSELVLELPDSVSHQIMVPFGKAAFFPGRMIHTNEFLVLLGESHYAERSAKQTVEILDRRSEFLDQKIAGAKSQIADLEAESTFVTNTAEEAKAGLVEIREEYLVSGQLHLNQSSTSRITGAASTSDTNSDVGSGSKFGASTSNSGNLSADEDREHELLMARLSELEMAEAAAGEDNEDNVEEVDEDTSAGAFELFKSDLHRRKVSTNENDLLDEEYDSEDTEEEDSQLSNSDDDDAYKSSEEEVKTEDKDYQTWRHGDQQKQEALKGKPRSRFAREAYSKKGALDSQPTQQNVTFQQGSPTEKKPGLLANHEIYSRTLEKPEAMQGFNDFQKEIQEWRREGVHQKERRADEMKGSSSESDRRRVPSTGEATAGQMKAFTGIVTEHSSPEPATPNEQQPKIEEAQQSKPMSKFKMRQAQAGRM